MLCIKNVCFERVWDTAMKKRNRIGSPVRFTGFLAVMILLVLAATINVLGLELSDQAVEPAYTEVRVQSGDTVWDLALEFGPQDEDVRRVVKRICRINGIAPEDLQPGQILQIPLFM